MDFQENICSFSGKNNIIQNNLYQKIIDKSEQFFFEVSTRNEKLNFVLSFSIIEEKYQVQSIQIIANPYINKADNNIEEIKRTLTRVSYKEKFGLNDFKDISSFYRNKKNLNLKNIFDDMIQSVKGKKARIIINKYHLVFNYFLPENNNNLIILCLDNELESNILEKYYENNFKKIYNSNHRNEEFENININAAINSNDIYDQQNEKEKFNNTNINKKLSLGKKSILENNINININNISKAKNGKQTRKSLKKSMKSKEQKNDEVKNKKNNKKSKSKNENLSKENNHEINQKKDKNINNENYNINNNTKKIQTISPSREEKDNITKNFLYGEYNFQVFNEEKKEKGEKEEKEEDKKIDNDFSDDESWGESLFFDKENKEEEKNENIKEDKNVNLLGNKKSRTKSKEKKSKERKDLSNNNINKEKEKKNMKTIEEKIPEEKDTSEIINNYKNSQNDIYNKNKKEINEETQIINLSEDDEEEETSNKNITSNNYTYSNNFNIDESSYSISYSYDNNREKNDSKIFLKSEEKIRENPLATFQRFNPKSQHFEKNQNLLSEPSDIINSLLEIKMIKEKIEPFNKLVFKLVYTSKKDKDNYEAFKKAVIDKYRHLILFKTTKNKKFGIYFNEKLFSSKSKMDQETTDLMSFIYSFDKKIFFIPKERIVCFTQSPSMPYLFKLSDHSIYIKNNFLSERHYLMEKSRVYGINNLFQELNGGEKEFSISLIEIYRAEINDQ